MHKFTSSKGTPSAGAWSMMLSFVLPAQVQYLPVHCQLPAEFSLLSMRKPTHLPRTVKVLITYFIHICGGFVGWPSLFSLPQRPRPRRNLLNAFFSCAKQFKVDRIGGWGGWGTGPRRCPWNAQLFWQPSTRWAAVSCVVVHRGN